MLIAASVGLIFAAEAGFLWTNGWVWVATVLGVIAVLVIVALDRLVMPRHGPVTEVVLGASMFALLLEALLLSAWVVYGTGLAGVDDNQSDPAETWGDLLVIGLILGPAFGAVVGLLYWAVRRSARLVRG